MEKARQYPALSLADKASVATLVVGLLCGVGIIACAFWYRDAIRPLGIVFCVVASLRIGLQLARILRTGSAGISVSRAQRPVRYWGAVAIGVCVLGMYLLFLAALTFLI